MRNTASTHFRGLKRLHDKSKADGAVTGHHFRTPSTCALNVDTNPEQPISVSAADANTKLLRAIRLDAERVGKHRH